MATPDHEGHGVRHDGILRGSRPQHVLTVVRITNRQLHRGTEMGTHDLAARARTEDKGKHGHGMHSYCTSYNGTRCYEMSRVGALLCQPHCRLLSESQGPPCFRFLPCLFSDSPFPTLCLARIALNRNSAELRTQAGRTETCRKTTSHTQVSPETPKQKCCKSLPLSPGNLNNPSAFPSQIPLLPPRWH